MLNRPAMSTVGGNSVGGSHHNVQSERLVNSTILREEFLNGMPLQDQIKYVEVPVIEEVIRHVPRKEYVEVEKRVPRYEYEWIERIVEIPQVQIIDRHVEVPQIQEVIRHVPVRQIVDVPKEVLKYVPKIETKIIEREVEVLGEIIEIPKPFVVENKIIIPKFLDQEVATVVAQRMHPCISESETEFLDVDVKEFNPYLVPVDVYLPKPVARNISSATKTQEHRVVDIPVAHFNALLKTANPGLSETDLEGRLVTVNGVAPVMYGPGSNQIIRPISSEWEAQRVPGQIHVIPVNGMSFSNANTTTQVYTTGGYTQSGGGYTQSGGGYTQSGGGSNTHISEYLQSTTIGGSPYSQYRAQTGGSPSYFSSSIGGPALVATASNVSSTFNGMSGPAIQVNRQQMQMQGAFQQVQQLSRPREVQAN